MTVPHLIYPCQTRRVTCGFYCYPFHYADDLGAVFEPCVASASGIVVTADNDVRYCEREGRYIEIVHRDGWLTRYFHLNHIDVQVGQYVQQGQRIGETGASGWTVNNGVCTPYAPHLHWALHAPSRTEALTVWSDPRQVVGGRWAVSPVYVVESQKEDEMKPLLVKCTDGFYYIIRQDGTRHLLCDRDANGNIPANTAAAQASSKRAADALLAHARVDGPAEMTGTQLYAIPPAEWMYAGKLK